MKLLPAIFCILFAFCILQTAHGANNLNTFRFAIQRLKNTVKSTVNSLTRFKSNSKYDLNRKLSNLKLDAMGNVNSISNPALQQIRNDVDSAKAEGKDAEHCYESGRLQLRDASMTAFDDLDKCGKTGLESIAPALSNVDTTIAFGNKVELDLDTIFPSCYNNNIFIMESCIAGKMPGANASVQSLENQATSVQDSVTTASSRAVNSAYSCNQMPLTNVRQAATNARLTARSCIKNA
ncbi:uncharacterized protein LOC107274189 [Cephus cinctus]|uniref:Uncharacterized protein LOC107274189 n=1 Tax=Cephus cinctus TaxID=211228 RepID=A0AAJ7CFJ2_CEPCN|nr:uncharacterized protein LOC107274189 [Cephus cinctus]